MEHEIKLANASKRARWGGAKGIFIYELREGEHFYKWYT